MQKNKPIYHTIFWVFIFFFVFDYLVFEFDLKTAISLSLLEMAIYMIICYVNLYVLIPNFYKPKKILTYLLIVLVFLGLLYIPYYYYELGYYLIDDNELRIAISFTLNYFLFIVISFLFWYLTLYQIEKHKTVILQNEKLQGELLLLKSQVSPHFLFNSLNNIYSLSIVKHDNASIMIEKLSDILRYIIYEGSAKTVLLEREVELIKNYVDLQLLKKLKAENNIAISIENVLSTHKIAPLILINIIENCFKHSDINYDANGFLKIDLKVENGILYFKTENSCQKRKEGGGVGLKNIKSQLEHYYPNTHELQIEDNLTTFTIKLTITL